MYTYAWYFVMFSFLGWCLEVIYHTVCYGEFSNRGFLNGPVCPIYGAGAVLVIAVLRPVADNLLLLFICAALITSALELVTGYVLETIFSMKWWDYSDVPFNLKGYICLKFSICWGVACTFLIRVVLPVCDRLLAAVPPKAGTAVLIVLGICYMADAVCTVLTLRSLAVHIKSMENLSRRLRRFADELGLHIADSVFDVMEKTENASKLGKEKAEELEALGKSYQKKLSELTFGHRRIIRAFPGVNSKRYRHSIEQLKQRIGAKKNMHE